MQFTDYGGFALVAALLALTAAFFHRQGKAGGSSVGVLGVPESAEPFDEGRQRMLTAAAALLGVSIRKQTIHITASFGVTMAQPSEIDAQAIIGRADAALYRAKDQGRNCVRLSIETAVA